MQKAKIVHIFRRKKLQLFFLFYVSLILPLLSPLAQNIPLKGVGMMLFINTALFLAISVFSFFLTPRGEKILYTLLLIFSTIPGAMFLGYLIFARVLLEQNSITSLFETNPEESKEFVLHYFNMWVIVGVTIYIIIPILMIWRMKSYRPLKIKRYKTIFAISLITILAIVFVSRLSQSVYFVNFYNTFASYRIRLYNENVAIEKRQHIDYSVEKVQVTDIPQTVVVVIGESLTRRHMQLYGYKRNTNPLLSAKKDSIYVYADVISPQVHTIPVIRSVLSFIDKEHPEHFVTKPSMFELFNRAGYDTYFISNQAFGGKFGTSYDALLNLADNKYDLSTLKKHDEVTLIKLQEILSQKTDKDRFIIIHLIGNHMAYKFRYSASFEVFNSEKDGFVKETSYINTEAVKSIDEYDNSVLYNDYVISQMIDLISSKCPNSVMVYFSDHGEELYDYRKFAGHAYEKVSTYMCEIPFIVWMSKGFKGNRPDLSINTNRPYSTDDFIHSISNLSGITYEDYDESRSIFSPQFNPQKRFVGDIPYNELIELKKR